MVAAPARGMALWWAMTTYGFQLPIPFDPDSRRVYSSFVQQGRIVRMPRKASKRATLLDLVASLFEPGVRYHESTVDDVLRAVFDDHATLRRYLVDDGLLDRDHNIYWRSGGTVVT